MAESVRIKFVSTAIPNVWYGWDYFFGQLIAAAAVFMKIIVYDNLLTVKVHAKTWFTPELFYIILLALKRNLFSLIQKLIAATVFGHDQDCDSYRQWHWKRWLFQGKSFRAFLLSSSTHVLLFVIRGNEKEIDCL